MKPPFAYFGGKARLAAQIADAMPAHDIYLEPFAGSLAVLFAKQPATHEIVNDLDDSIITFFRVLRDQPDELERSCRLTPYSRAEFDHADHTEPGLTDLERARRFWCRVNQSFGKTSRMATGWSLARSQNVANARSAQNRVDRFAACAARLRDVSIESCDAVDLIDRLAAPGAVIYADPPYLAETRTSKAGQGAGVRSDYRVEFATPDHHERLADALHRAAGIGATVLLSGYHSPLYDRLYASWHHAEWDVYAQSSNGANATQRRTRRVEVIWSNQPVAAAQRLDFAGEAS